MENRWNILDIEDLPNDIFKENRWEMGVDYHDGRGIVFVGHPSPVHLTNAMTSNNDYCIRRHNPEDHSHDFTEVGELGVGKHGFSIGLDYHKSKIKDLYGNYKLYMKSADIPPEACNG